MRHVVGEAAWSYRNRPAKWPRSEAPGGQSEDVKAIAWKAQHRLNAPFRKLCGARQSRGRVVTAISRELLGFVWAIGVQVEKQRLPRRSLSWYRAVSGRAAHEKEHSRLICGTAWLQPATLVRDSSRPGGSAERFTGRREDGGKTGSSRAHAVVLIVLGDWSPAARRLRRASRRSRAERFSTAPSP